MRVAENEALIRRFYEEVWNLGNVAFTEQVFADDYVRHDLRPTRALPGPEGQAAIATDFRAAFPDLHTELDLVLGEGDLVAARWTAEGTNTGTWGERPPTGRRVRFSGVNIFRLMDGKVVELWNHRDDLGVMQQLGAEVFAGAVPTGRGYPRTVDYETYVEHVRQDGRRLAAAASGNLSNDVPSCPGWTVSDLVSHVAEVYEHKIACTALGSPPDPWPPAWPSERDPLEWLGDAHQRLLGMFEASDATTPSATWWPPDQTVGFWARRMAQETAVHRIDAELAVGSPTPVDAELAVDGVDEILLIMLAGDWSDEPDDAATGQRVAVSTGGRTWLVTLEREVVSIADEAGDADATLSGDPSDVLLWLWGRAPDERLTRSGDQDAIRLLRARLVLATQ